ncbi:DUF5131 family protein [Thermococcus sp.]
MNRTKIEWTDFTWNPVVGCYNYISENACRVGKHCYARKIAKRQKHRCKKCYRFEPHIHPERLAEPYKLKKPSRIFVCSMGDLFGDWIPKEWIKLIIKVAEENPQHIFQFLTKNPKRYRKFKFPDNCWLGTTVNHYLDSYRAGYLTKLKGKNIKFISFEPLYSEIQVLPENIDWIIIGAQTNPTLQPKKEWVDSLITLARKIGAAVFLKNNLNYPRKIQEFPAGP